MCWRRLLRTPWTARRSNQSILKESSPRCSLEGLMLKLKLQYFGHLMRIIDSLEKTVMLGGIGAGGQGDDRGWDGWMASPTLWTWVWVNSRSWWWTRRPGVLRFMGLQGSDMTERLNWTEFQKWTRFLFLSASFNMILIFGKYKYILVILMKIRILVFWKGNHWIYSSIISRSY